MKAERRADCSGRSRRKSRAAKGETGSGALRLKNCTAGEETGSEAPRLKSCIAGEETGSGALRLKNCTAGEETAGAALREKKRALRAELIKLRCGLDAEYRRRADAAVMEALKRQEAYRRAKVLFIYVSVDAEPDTRQLIAGALAEGKRVAVPRCAAEGAAGTDTGGHGKAERAAKGAAGTDTGAHGKAERAAKGAAGTDTGARGKAERGTEGAAGPGAGACGKLGTGLMDAYEIRSADDLVPGAYGIPEPADTCAKVEPDEIDLCVVPCLCVGADGIRLGYGGGYYDRYLPRLRSGTVKVCLCREKTQGEQPPAGPYDVPVDMTVTEEQVIFYEIVK